MDQYNGNLKERMESHFKNENSTTEYKMQGNELYAAKNYTDALINYNKALCCAVKGTEDVGLLYANRSAVALEMKSYTECLKNIQLARKNGYPKQMLPKLKKREEKCQAMISNVKSSEKKN